MEEISESLIKRAAEGDVSSFEKIYRAYSGFVYTLALKLTHNQQDAQEAAQDVFMKVYRSLRSFRFQSALKTWIYRIAVTTAFNHYRKNIKHKKNRIEFDDAVEIKNTVEAGNPPEDSDLRIRIDKALEKMSPKLKACLLLRELEGLNYKEISKVLNVPVNTVRSRLKRAREALLSMRQA